ncbi:WYL domain-containing protein [Sphaerisporangium fuscum]|uniref:WYL domain-containing protein n=1 Tax=Sphaerisporangium fuscum TaxID=2835868 RepID=UPI001BDD58AD|nr:WYL domain-containing protein [Sphaerisporangium fuscum]
MCPEAERVMDVDPWVVVVRRGRWYLLCWSHTRNARRVELQEAAGLLGRRLLQAADRPVQEGLDR